MFCKDLNQIKQVFRLAYTQAELMLKSGKQIDVEVTEHINKRSSEQNNYLWLLNGWIADCLNDAGVGYGKYQIPYDKDIIHKINKYIFKKKTTRNMPVKNFFEYTRDVMVHWIQETNGAFEVPELPKDYLERKGYTEMMK